MNHVDCMAPASREWGEGMTIRQKVAFGLGCIGCAMAGAGIESARRALKVPSVPDMQVEREVVRLTRTTPGQTVVVRDEALASEAEALRSRVAELEQALAARDAAPAAVAVSHLATNAAPARAGRPERESWEQRMERMRTEEPERYAEMQKRREEFRQQMEQRARERADFLDAVDVAGMNDAQRENHEKLLALVARANELGMQLMQGGGRGEQGEALRREMGETMSALSTLYEMERDYLLEATAKAVGYDGEDVKAFTEHIRHIMENTSPMPGFGRRRGGR